MDQKAAQILEGEVTGLFADLEDRGYSTQQITNQAMAIGLARMHREATRQAVIEWCREGADILSEQVALREEFELDLESDVFTTRH